MNEKTHIALIPSGVITVFPSFNFIYNIHYTDLFHNVKSEIIAAPTNDFERF